MTTAWFAAAAFAAALNAGQDAPAPAEQTDAQPAQTGPQLALEAPASNPDPLLQNAETYAAYHGDVGEAGRRELRSGADLDATMDALTRYYEGDRLVDAQIAYAALVAAQHPEFIDSVRAVADYYGADTARAALMNDPVYVTGFMGADQASDSVVGAISEDVSHMEVVGERYRQAAYDLQSSTWAARRAADRQERLSSLETASERLEANFRLNENAPSAVNASSGRLGSAAALFAERTPAAGPTLPDLEVNVGEAQLEPDERRVGRMLAVAALQSIEDGDMTALDYMLDDPGVERCITWARLTMAQCVAAGHFKYEDSFCIAEHALLDVAECLTATRPVSN
ncbi:MAG: hypothetical protein RKE49_08500 [Oceanicaulis sp.]